MGEEQIGLKQNEATTLKIYDALNIANVTTSQNSTESGDNFGTYTIVAVQLSWKDLTGTLDAEVKLQQSITGESTDWDDMGVSKVLNSGTDSHTLADTTFSGVYLRAVFTKNNCTGGTLNATLVGKD